MRCPVSSALILVLSTCVGAACAPPTHQWDPEVAFVEGAPGRVFQGMRVDEVTGCSTSVLAGLSQQLVDAVNCARPETLVVFSSPNVVVGAAVFPYLQPPAKDSLLAAVVDHGGSMQVNSAFRTLAQQYLLYSWYQQRTCGISLAARPGRSNHESGLALDVQDHDAWKAALEGFGWLWLGSSDPVHFDFAGGGTVDLSNLSVQAFQQLWNRNNPNDPIGEDGLYGPDTEARLRQSPADGFPLVLCAPASVDGGRTDGGASDAGSRLSNADGGSGAAGSGGDADFQPLDLGCGCAEVPSHAPWLAGIACVLLGRRWGRRRPTTAR